MRHFKLYYGISDKDWQESFDQFDPRTLADLVAFQDGGRPKLFDDGRNEDQPYATLPLERWRDR